MNAPATYIHESVERTLLHPHQLYDYQKECVLHQLIHPDSMLWLQMGLGKTAITLTTIVDRMRAGQVQKTLIFGPLRVIQAVWAREARKWSHTRHLRFSVMHGTKDKRLRALFADADIFLCNYENMNWLAHELKHYYLSQGKPLPFQMVVYDEVSKLKNSTTARMGGGHRERKDRRGEVHKIKLTGWREIIPHFHFRTGLTGTPASNGYIDLHGQFLAVDGGKRLGEYVSHFRDAYFISDYMGWGYEPTKEGKQWIEYHISDITKKMDARDYLDLPPVKVTNLLVDMPPASRKHYQEVEDMMFTQLDSGCEIEVFSRASVSNKCLQICIAEGTEVLTVSGWKPIEQFRPGDKVWDGEEWVSIDRCAYNGEREVIECDGVLMTPDHKVLTVSGWTEAQEVVHGDADERLDRATVRLPEGYYAGRVDDRREQKSNVVGGMRLRKAVCSDRAEPKEPAAPGCEVLRVSPQRGTDSGAWDSRHVTHPAVCELAEHAHTLQRPKGQGFPELWRQGYQGLQRVGRFIRGVLARHGCDVSGACNIGAAGQQRRLHPGELPLANDDATGKQQAHQYVHQHTVGKNDGDASGAPLQSQGRDNLRQNSQRVARGGFDSPCRVKKVYDLINAGPRHRFTVRGRNGELLLVHNCNGSPYVGMGAAECGNAWEALHDAKLDALESVLEEAGGSPVLCSYSFVSDAKRIMERFKKYKPVNLTTTKSSATEKVINDWNAGKVRLLIAHPQSAGHGLDGLQDTGHILVWFGMPWSLELYEQMNGRLDRNGQKHPVSIIRILCRDSLDLAVADAIERKTDDQEGLKRALQRYRDGVTTNDLKVNFF